MSSPRELQFMISRRLRVLAACCLALAAMLGFTTGAFAHAQYASSTPAANATLPAAPTTVQITYTQELSDIHISITGPDGSEVTTAPAIFDLEQRHNASVPMRDDGPGRYTVLWHNVSGDDGDPNDGTFLFMVSGSGSSTSPTPVPSAGVTSPAAAPACIDNGVRTPGINDARVETYCERQAIRDKYAGQIDISSFNAALADGEGLESALSDAMADFQAERAARKR